MKKIFTFLFFLVLGIAVVYLYLLWQKQTVLTTISLSAKQGMPFIFSLNEAPKNALKATITDITGDVKWVGRVATEAAILQKEIQLQQGEDVVTGKDGKITFSFDDAADISLLPDSRIEITQTLPQNLVFRQTAGESVYVSGNSPLAVRVEHLISSLKDGEERITIDNDTGEVTIKAVKGAIKLGFNDLDYQSITVELHEGDTYVYDDATRTGAVQ